MVTISSALSAGRAQSYHKLEFTAKTQTYYKQDGAVVGLWQGRLAETFGLKGPVDAEEFAKLSEGKHPGTHEALVHHRKAQDTTNADGTITKAVEHRAAWDATFSAPKSISLTALVGGDERVREAHAAAVTTALNRLEGYTQARIGGNNPAETTGKFIAAKFEHDSARPVDGYAAPQLHTHAVIFNVTERADRTTRALQPQAFFDSQSFVTAVYQSALTYELRNRGYEIETGKSGAPEIKGYSQEYLDASSLRSQQIKEHMEKHGRNSPEAAQIAALATRDSKQLLSPQEVLAAHREMAAEFGDQPQKIVAEARERALSQVRKPEDAMRAQEAVAYAKSSIYEREAVADERVILRDALRRGMGETTYAAVKAEFDARQSRGEFLEARGQKHDTGRGFTTPETVAAERANVAHVMRGLSQVKPLMTKDQAAEQALTRPFLNDDQRTVIREVLTTPDRIHGLQGLAGTGKTTVLDSIREGAEKQGYAVEGFAPSSRAAGQLRDAGIKATTLQSFIAGGRGKEEPDSTSRHLYMLDESSLASTKQMRAFLGKIGPNDRVLVIGDTGQHQAVDAGRPFQQMQDAGMQTSKLSEIVRQKDPELLKAVELLAKGETAAGVKLLADQGRITEVPNGDDRIAAIAKDYAAKPENTLIVSPDNRSRVAINQAVRVELQANGTLAPDGHEYNALAHRSDMTGADRMWAARYNTGDVLQYATGSKALGIGRESYATVRSVDTKTNTLTVERADGGLVSYDPKRLKGVNVYVEVQREIAVGERVQFTAQHRGHGLANRDLGTVTEIKPHEITVKMDGKEGRLVPFDPARMRHFEHGYAVTSHSAQGLTAGRIIANIDGETARSLVNNRLAYVAISRAAEDARIYTNDAKTLGQRLATEISKTAAVDFTEKPRPLEERAGVEGLRKEPSIREYADVNHRISAVAMDFAARPENTVIVAPDRAERMELTQLIRAELKVQGGILGSRQVPVLTERQPYNPRIAANYSAGDVIQFKAGNKKHEIAGNSMVTVAAIDSKKNLLTIQTADGKEISYNPALTRSMTQLSTVYKPEQRELGIGDRIQVTAPHKEQGIRSRDLGTVTKIDADHRLVVRLDNGKTVEVAPDKARFIEHGYAVEGTKNFHAQRVLVSIGGTAEVAADSALARVISRSSASTTFYTSDGPTFAENQAASQARLAKVASLVTDQTYYSVPTAAEIAKLFPTAEMDRRLAPIRQALPPEALAHFQWKADTYGIQTYRHNETGRNIHIDAKGQFYTQEGKPTSREAALDRAMPVGQEPLRMEYGPGLGIGR